jgi:hypothetical protein
MICLCWRDEAIIMPTNKAAFIKINSWNELQIFYMVAGNNQAAYL